MTEEKREIEIKVFDFYFTCKKCGKETSISTSQPLLYDSKVCCISCKSKFKILHFKGEPQMEIGEYQ